ncbi:MAG: thiamine kinase-like enzyme [Francisellaceae bacterium]|jgi:thiamine kinase-like enzyme
MIPQQLIQDVFNQFKTNDTFLSSKPYGSGHINDTLLVRTEKTIGNEHDYIMQRINHNVFKNIPELMDNIVRVTEHVHKKLLEIPNSRPEVETLIVILTKKDDQPYIIDSEGNYWRMYIFISEGVTHDLVTDYNMAYQGGQKFGQFQRLLDDLPGGPLFETIPEFHNIELRLKTLFEAKTQDIKSRAKNCQAELDFIEKNAPFMFEVLRLGQDKKIPLRVTHNDTKFNNVLLDSENKGLCVIDLDTVMPGYVHYDYSDSIRTVTNTSMEDEADLSKVNMDMNLFEGYTKGFMEEVAASLNLIEKESLGRSVKLLPFTIGVRFLTDYLQGDKYFKIHTPDHNLKRAKVQFKLTQSIIDQQDKIDEFFKPYL